MNPRLRRLQADYDLVREVFSGHPHVRVEPLGSRLPPENYRVDLQLPGLYLDGDQPNYRDSHSVEIMLPREYPAEKPYCVPLTPVFHPNIRDYYCLADYWAAGQTLVDVIVKIGDMIQWRTYNPASPLDAVAAKWAVQQEPTGIFPISKIDLGVSDFQVQLRPARAAQELAAVDDGAGDESADATESSDDDFVVSLRR